MRQVTGFQAKDGTFFETLEECRFHEAEVELIAALSMMRVDAMKFLAIIENHPVLIEEYVHARKAYRTTKTLEAVEQGTWSEYDPCRPLEANAAGLVGQDQIDDAFGEGEASPVLALKADGREPVSALGSGTQSEAVRDEREGDGFGGRRDDA